MTTPTTSNTPTHAARPRSRSRNITRISACLLLAFTIATIVSVVLSMNRYNAQTVRTNLFVFEGDDIVRDGMLFQAAGVDSVVLNYVPNLMDLRIPGYVPDITKEHRTLRHAPHWVRRDLPDTTRDLAPSSVFSMATGWPFRMYRLTSGYWVNPANANLLRQIRVPHTTSHNKNDAPFRCPVFRFNQVYIATPGPVFGYSTWGAIQTEPILSQLPPSIATHIDLPDIIPITPIWSGLILNTTFYAVLLWLLAALANTIRRELKNRANPTAIPCPNCHYNLAGITQPICPECGTTRNTKLQEDQPEP